MQNSTRTALSLALLLPAAAPCQVQPHSEAGEVTRTFHLQSQMNQAEQNDVVTGIRNTVPPTLRIFLVTSQNTIIVRGTPADVQGVADLIPQLDHPHKQYRLTYTLTETDGGKRIGVQHYSMVLTSGERMQLKEGSRIPIFTTSYNKDQSIDKQFTYLDVGLNFDSTVRDYAAGVELQSKVEQSAVVAEKSAIGPEDPVIRQTRVEGTSYLTEGKPLVLGSLDVLGSTRRLEVEVLVEGIR